MFSSWSSWFQVYVQVFNLFYSVRKWSTLIFLHVTVHFA